MNTVYERLYGDTDIYAGLNVDDYPSDMCGWNDSFSIMKEWEGAKLIVEVGSWKGASLFHWADYFRCAKFVCIDTWLGAGEMWSNRHDPARYGALRLRNGYPNLYYEFLSNVVRNGIKDRVTPMPMPSNIALDLLFDWKIKPDIIYIDADHSYEGVKRDIIKALALEPRVLAGDDFQPGWPGVMQAVRELLPHAHHDGVLWWV